MSVCLYNKEYYKTILPPRQKKGKMEQYEKKYKYFCRAENCDENTLNNKGMHYKEFSIHFGGRHDVLERWAQESNLDGAQELYTALKSWREATGRKLQSIPQYTVLVHYV